MKATISIQGKEYTIDLDQPIDLSIPLSADENNPEAWYLDRPVIEPAGLGDWVGSVKEGASVNFNTITFNPHAHGTHTECLGHITEEFHSVNEALKRFFFTAELISVKPEKSGGDLIISKDALSRKLNHSSAEAVIIRTLPNSESKLNRSYSNANWPYLEGDAALWLREKGVQHLLIDLPSVDKEKDDGALTAHKAFWNVPDDPRMNCTITEFIYVPDVIEDGTYMLNLQIAPFHNDAAPSKPVLYSMSL